MSDKIDISGAKYRSKNPDFGRNVANNVEGHLRHEEIGKSTLSTIGDNVVQEVMTKSEQYIPPVEKSPLPQNLSQIHQELREYGVLHTLKSIIKNLAVGGIAVIGLSIAGVIFAFAFAVYLILKSILGLIAVIVMGIIFAIGFVLRSIFEKLIESVMLVAIVGIGWYAFWEYNPELERQFDHKLSWLNGVINQHIGLSIPKIPEFDDIFSIFSNKVSEKIPKSLMDIVSSGSLDSLGGGGAFPKELEPMMKVTQDPKEIKKYLELLKSGNIGINGEGAVDLLSRSIISRDSNLSNAAYSSLKLINSPRAKSIIRRYEKLVKDEMKDLKRAMK